MSAEGQISEFFLYLLAAGGLFVAFAAIQRHRISKLEKELDRLTLRYQQHLAASNPKQTDVFASSPFPCCIIDRHGSIVSSNPLFDALVSPVKIRTVLEFDKLTLASLGKSVAPSGIFHDSITIRAQETQRLRQFTVVSWPLKVPHAAVGRVLTFHEQTQILKKRSNQAAFEKELLRYMEELSAESAGELAGASHNTEALRALNKELSELSRYLLSLHAPLRERRQIAYADLVAATKEAVEDIRPFAKARKHSFTLTLPRSSGVAVEKESFKLALSTLLTALADFSPRESVRLHIDRSGSRTILAVTAEKLVLSESAIEKLFQFGERSQRPPVERALGLRCAIVRELCGSQGIGVEASSHPETGTIFTFSIVAKRSAQ